MRGTTSIPAPETGTINCWSSVEENRPICGWVVAKNDVVIFAIFASLTSIFDLSRSKCNGTIEEPLWNSLVFTWSKSDHFGSRTDEHTHRRTDPQSHAYKVGTADELLQTPKRVPKARERREAYPLLSRLGNPRERHKLLLGAGVQPQPLATLCAFYLLFRALWSIHRRKFFTAVVPDMRSQIRVFRVVTYIRLIRMDQLWFLPEHGTVKRGWLVAWYSGRTLFFDRRTFPVLLSTCSWRVTTYVGKPSLP